jgi:hypothetical protein
MLYSIYVVFYTFSYFKCRKDNSPLLLKTHPKNVSKVKRLFFQKYNKKTTKEKRVKHKILYYIYERRKRIYGKN